MKISLRKRFGILWGFISVLLITVSIFSYFNSSTKDAGYSLLAGVLFSVMILIFTYSYATKSLVKPIEEMTQKMKESANMLMGTSIQISTATSQVVIGAIETATAVSQITATIEEVKQATQLAAQKARQVSESTKRSAEVSLNGKKSVEESIEGMTLIKKQMDLLGENIMKLSGQSQAIGEVILSVSDLAEQFNLLSVNASIEAAKAGEQGRGFAVVAQEVKALAEQSKQATLQVHHLLNGIQRATRSAVLSAEQGAKAVDVGMKQVIASGEVIRVLSENVSAAAQTATVIAASSQQQFQGVDQVAIAMGSIKQATQKNVTGTKQVETGTQSLNKLGTHLKQLVEQCKV